MALPPLGLSPLFNKEAPLHGMQSVCETAEGSGARSAEAIPSTRTRRPVGPARLPSLLPLSSLPPPSLASVPTASHREPPMLASGREKVLVFGQPRG